MKKFYSILAAALISVCAFASKDVVPSDEVLAEFYDQGQVCLCFFVPADMNCNDIVVTGSFNGWSDDLTKCIAVEAVEGYDGWYVASFEPEEEPDAERGIQAKPVMKGGDGAFNWSYQVGAATAIRGGVQVVEGGIAGEIDLINYGTDAPNVYTIEAWKQNPCTAVYHNYTVAVINNAGCDGLAVPFLIGEMTGWSSKEMQLDVDKSIELGAAYYTYSFKAREGAEFQILSGLYNSDGELIATPGWNEDSYLQVFKDGEWIRIPGESGDNLITKEDPSIVLDIRNEEQYRWARCAAPEPEEYTVIWINLPTENSPEAVEIIGTFDNWEGTAMEHLDNGWWFVELEAKASQYFKIRSAGSWDQQLELYDGENDSWSQISDGQLKFGKLWVDDKYKGVDCKSFELDWSDPEICRWTVASGIEDIVLTEQAQKIMVDGVLYIVRDNKLFNVQGAQVR